MRANLRRKGSIGAYFARADGQERAYGVYKNSTRFVRSIPMRFHFNLHDAEELIPDGEGSELADLEAARAEARATARRTGD